MDKPADRTDLSEGPNEPSDMLLLEQFLPYRLSVLTNTVSSTLAGEYQARFGMSVPQWRVMAVLGRFPDLSASEVAEKTAMDKVMVSRAVAALIDAGRIDRRMDDTDRRRSVLRLSAAGRAVYDEIVPIARAYERRLLAALNADDAAVLDRILKKLQARAGQLADDI